MSNLTIWWFEFCRILANREKIRKAVGRKDVCTALRFLSLFAKKVEVIINLLQLFYWFFKKTLNWGDWDWWLRDSWDLRVEGKMKKKRQFWIIEKVYWGYWNFYNVRRITTNNKCGNIFDYLKSVFCNIF